MLNNKTLFAALLIFAFVFTSCDKEEPMIEEEVELITTLTYSLTSTNGEVVVFSFSDLDGDGGNAPIIQGGELRANQTYLASLDLLNASESPAESITEEIAEEDEEHQFFFSSDIAGINFLYNDEDEDGNPVGLSSTVTTGAAGSGAIMITLRHEPNKGATGVSDGDISNAGGETDIEVSFPVDVL